MYSPNDEESPARTPSKEDLAAAEAQAAANIKQLEAWGLLGDDEPTAGPSPSPTSGNSA